MGEGGGRRESEGKRGERSGSVGGGEGRGKRGEGGGGAKGREGGQKRKGGRSGEGERREREGKGHGRGRERQRGGGRRGGKRGKGRGGKEEGQGGRKIINITRRTHLEHTYVEVLLRPLSRVMVFCRKHRTSWKVGIMARCREGRGSHSSLLTTDTVIH